MVVDDGWVVVVKWIGKWIVVCEVVWWVVCVMVGGILIEIGDCMFGEVMLVKVDVFDICCFVFKGVWV